MSTTETSSSTTARTVRVVCLTASLARGSSGRSLIQQSSAVSSRATIGRALGVGEHVAAADVDVVLEPDRDRLRRRSPRSSAPSKVSTAATRVRAAGRQHDDVVAGAPDAAGDLAGVAAVVVVLVGHRPDHPLHREAPVVEVAVAGELDRLEVLEQRRARRTRASRRRGRRRCRRAAPTSGSRARRAGRAGVDSACRSASISRKRSSEKSTRSILFTATTTCGIARIDGDVGSGGASARPRPCARRAGSRRRPRSTRR